ncbi:MAG TPA: LuxR C-terminal-related transcriptional regulator [Gaiellaceae bacterium]|nr:LuxR C-terminal-related transcriptional regulator [Gaiellaceae bacterium]
MVRLQRADLEALLTFLGDVAELEFDEPYPFEVVARVQELVRCDALMYQELDLHAKSFLTMVGIGSDGEDDDDELYWTVGPCPISDYRARTGDLRAVTMSDVIGRRRYHELPIFREYFRPAGIDYMIDLGLPTTLRRHRSFILFREAGAGDFCERDRAVLEMLRPHLYRLEAHAALRRRLSEALRKQDGNDDESNVYAELTPREREIIELVAEGKKNAQIAAQLWVAPSTVKKHLEHVYEKLGVGGRTAAATLARASR